MSAKVLKKELKDVKRDGFANGDVIRWTSSGKYTYAALKTPVGWYTTAKAMPDYAQRVPQVVTFDELIELLSKSHVNDIQIATVWTKLEEA